MCMCMARSGSQIPHRSVGVFEPPQHRVEWRVIQLRVQRLHPRYHLPYRGRTQSTCEQRAINAQSTGNQCAISVQSERVISINQADCILIACAASPAAPSSPYLARSQTCRRAPPDGSESRRRSGRPRAQHRRGAGCRAEARRRRWWRRRGGSNAQRSSIPQRDETSPFGAGG